VTRAPRSGRAGLTLVELLVAMTVTGIVGAALIQIIMAQNRSAGTNEAWRTARSVSRGSLNRLLVDLESVNADSALEAGATAQSITFRTPYAFGVACNTTIPLTVSVLPVDNSAWAAARFAGWAWRDAASGKYRYRMSGGPTLSAGNAAVCSAANIVTLPASAGGGTAGRVVQLGAPSMGTGSGYSGLVPTVGMNVMLLQRVRYRFAPSAALAVSMPSAIALWRDVIGGTSEELAAPFDSTARFRFYVTGSDVPQDAVPSPITMTRGIEVHLDGMSETVPQGSITNKRMQLTTSIFFKNRRD
jgi:prepilin-type N-terminal cleavage/methylation domain-containing protein